MVIHLHTPIYNEAEILPFYLQHYAWVDRIFIYDNGSTDGGPAIAAKAPNVEVVPFVTDGVFRERDLVKLRNTCWHSRSRGKANWVIIADADEFLFHHTMSDFLSRISSRGVTICRSYGYEMVHRSFPYADEPITSQCRTGVQAVGYSKLCLFNPDRIRTIQYEPGAHDAQLVGDINLLNCGSLLLLHYKRLGWDFYWRRVQRSVARLDPDEVSRGWHIHIRRDESELWDEFMAYSKQAVDVTT